MQSAVQRGGVSVRFGRTALGLLSAAAVCAFAPFASAQFAAVQVAGHTAGNPLIRPIFVTHAPGDYSRVFILEKEGRIRILDISTLPNPTLQLDTAPFLDHRVPVIGGTSNGDERGLLGLAFHPQYQTNGKLYLYYTTNNPGAVSRISEFTNRNPTTLAPSPASSTLDPSSERIMMEFSQPQSNHNGGWMSFGPDGYLYISTGDGGGAGDGADGSGGHNVAIGNGLDRSTLLGKMLRIDVNGTGAVPEGGTSGPTGGYTVPQNNPFVGVTGADDEIWAYGLRNAWRSSFDRATGDLWIADVGQGLWEEINYQPALTSSNLAVVSGRNYGWRCFEGTVDFIDTTPVVQDPPCPAAYNAAGWTGPLGVYDHFQSVTTSPPRRLLNSVGGAISGCSISGGYVYRGCAVPELVGQYLFTDYCGGRVYRTTHNGSGGLVAPTEMTSLWAGSGAVTPSIPSLSRPTNSLVSFGEDAYGEIYIVSMPNTGANEVNPNGRIFKIVSTVPGHVPLSNTDISRDGTVSIDDLFIFLNQWFLSAPNADYNRVGGVTIDDLFTYLNGWFRGSCPF